MAKYNEETKKKCVNAVKEGKSLAAITKLFGPNPKAIQRYCKAAGVVIPKAKKKETKKASDIVNK